MSTAEEILANTKATMAMEGMPLTKADKDVLRSCLEGDVTFDEALAAAVEEFHA